jgi:hypothetical protein
MGFAADDHRDQPLPGRGAAPLLAVTSDRIQPAFVVAGVQGLLQQVNDPASFALVPRIVATDHLVQANAANTAGSSIARLVGSPLGGIAVAFGGLETVVVVDAIRAATKRPSGSSAGWRRSEASRQPSSSGASPGTPIRRS